MFSIASLMMDRVFSPKKGDAMILSLRVLHVLDQLPLLCLLLVELDPLVPERYLSVPSVRNDTPESVVYGMEPASDVILLITVTKTVQ